MTLFNPDFYPTPREVIDRMLFGIDLKDKTVLEPSAGSGNFIEVLKEHGSNVICCEINNDLAKVSSSKADRFLKDDFLKVGADEISHIDFIIANPPFSKDQEHIQHMWDVAPEGCQIISLCNYETINNTYSYGRKSLKYLINDNGFSEDLGECFTTAERKTDVRVGLVRLFKPKTNTDDEFEGYFDLSEEYEQQEDGIMKHSEIKEIVQRYVGAVNMFNSVVNATDKINDLISPIDYQSGIRFGAFQKTGSYETSINRDTFKKELQKSAWKSVFNKINMQKYVTSSVMSDINRFVEKQTNVPFTVNNIYKMMEMIIGTQGQRMERVIVEAFDDITKHHHENRYYKEGWKTNDQYRVGKKFIKNGNDCKMSYEGTAEASYSYSNRGYFMDDLTKALCFVTGKNYKECDEWWDFMNNRQNYEKEVKYRDEKTREIKFYTTTDSKNMGREWGKWHVFNFVKFKVYKKGTIHVEFLDDKVWDNFNRIACKAKGFHLAEKFTRDYRKKETGVEIYE